MRMGHSLYGLEEDRLKAADPTIVFTQGNVNVTLVHMTRQFMKLVYLLKTQ